VVPYIVKKTTLYLPDSMKRAVEAEAVHRGVSEAEVIRQAISAAVVPIEARARGAVFASDVLLADDVDRQLTGFGDR